MWIGGSTRPERALPVSDGDWWNQVAVRLGRIARSLQHQDSDDDAGVVEAVPTCDVSEGSW